MKKFIYILAALSALMLTGCGKEEPAEVKPAIELISIDTSFPAMGGLGTAVFKVDESLQDKVEAKSSKSWVTITSIAKETVTFTVAPSPDALDRSANVTLTAGDLEATFTILQRGVEFQLDQDNTTLEIDPTGVEGISLSYNTTGEPPVVGDVPEWLHVEISDTHVTFDADLNLTNEVRSAAVEVTQGWKTATVYVVQDPASVLSYYRFGCDADQHSSEPITIAEYALEELACWYYETEYDWITATQTENTLQIHVAANTTGLDREGSILIKNGERTVYTFPVIQTRTNIHSLAGIYQLPFYNGSVSAVSVWDLTVHRDQKSLRGRIYYDTPRTEGYTLKLEYVASGENAPMLTLNLPQELGTVSGEEYKIWATLPSGQYATTYGQAGFELEYRFGTSSVTFDFRTSDYTYEWFPNGLMGLYITHNGSNKDYLMPALGNENLVLTKWGSGNHDGFRE